MIFFDDDGETYMYLNDHQVAKLKPNMIELAEEPQLIEYAPEWVQNDHDKKFEEGSYVFKHNGKYYFTYSNWQENGPTAYYGIGDSPYGPFDWKGELAGPTAGAPDHHSIINFQGEYYYFYHMDTPWEEKNEIGWHGHRRLTCYDRMYIDPDNTIQVVQRTYGEPIYVPDGSSSNPCDSNPCSSGSTCVNEGNGNYQCEYNDPCTAGPCKSSETCLDLGNGKHSCQYDDPCNPDPCGDASCLDKGNGQFECQVEDPCAQNPCPMGTTCTSLGMDTYECRYDNPCDLNPCGSGQYCVNRGEGKHVCKYADPCDKNPCTEAGRFCINKGEGEYRCKYDDPCDPNPCDNFSTCIDFGNGKHECQPRDLCEGECKDWETCHTVSGDKHECEYVSPCLENPCQQDKICIDKGRGNFACRAATRDQEAPASIWESVADFFQFFIDAILSIFQ